MPVFGKLFWDPKGDRADLVICPRRAHLHWTDQTKALSGAMRQTEWLLWRVIRSKPMPLPSALRPRQMVDLRVLHRERPARTRLTISAAFAAHPPAEQQRRLVAYLDALREGCRRARTVTARSYV